MGWGSAEAIQGELSATALTSGNENRRGITHPHFPLSHVASLELLYRPIDLEQDKMVIEG